MKGFESMIRRGLAVVTAAGMLVGPLPVRAAAFPDTAITLGEVVVTSGWENTPPAAVTVISGDKLKNEVVDESQDLLKKVPGVAVAEFNQGIITSDIGLRGFNTEGSTPNTKLLIDGIPSNVHVGVNNLREIFPLEIESIEVFRGTADPRYGLYNVAGNINVATKEGGDRVELKSLYGAFATTENQALAAKSFGPLSQTVFAGYRDSKGFRAHSAQNKLSASSKTFLDIGEKWRTGVILRAYEMDAQSPGYLSTSDNPRENPSFSPAFAQADGGEQSNRHASLHLDGNPAESLEVSLRAYGQSFDRHRFVRFGGGAGVQTERSEDEKQTGAIATVTSRPGFWDASFTLGADAQRQENVYERYNTVNRARSLVQPVSARNQEFTLLNYGSFASANVRPLSPLRLTAGMRYDRLTGDLTNRFNGSVRPMVDYDGLWQPKLGAVLDAPGGKVSLYGNWGITFGIAPREGSYNTVDLPSSKNRGWETGVKVAPASWMTARVAYWKMVSSDESRVLFGSPLADSESLGETLRKGIDVEVAVDPVSWLSVWGAWTRQDSRYLNPGAVNPLFRGRDIDHTPRYLVKGGVDLRPVKNLTASLSVSAQGDYHTINPESYSAANIPTIDRRFGAYELADLDVTYAWTALTLGVHVKNIFDRYYEYVWNNGTTPNPNFAPGDPRAVYVSAALRFGGAVPAE